MFPCRLEKLEYKEILTPSWREVGPAVVNGNDSAAEKPLSNHCSEEEVSLVSSGESKSPPHSLALRLYDGTMVLYPFHSVWHGVWH